MEHYCTKCTRPKKKTALRYKRIFQRKCKTWDGVLGLWSLDSPAQNWYPLLSVVSWCWCAHHKSCSCRQAASGTASSISSSRFAPSVAAMRILIHRFAGRNVKHFAIRIASAFTHIYHSALARSLPAKSLLKSFSQSVCTHETIRELLDGISLNFILEGFKKNCTKI
jgi:hypothetical protein